MSQRLTPDEDLDRLVRRLNSAARDLVDPPAGATGEEADAETVPSGGRWRPPALDAEAGAWLDRLLGDARARYATDLLLVAGAPPTLRVHGRLEPSGERPLSAAAAELLCGALVPAERRPTLAQRGTIDFSLRLGELGRFRCNVHRERGGWAAAVRLFPAEPPELESLNLPPALGRFSELHHGLVLVTGPTGSGKTTTLAALVRRLLRQRKVHLVTIEDPVEYEHEHGGSVVEHVEIGRDAESFAAALRSVLRQDPDVLLIGEMRDPESIGIALTAAETGHLVLSTLHTGDAPQTVHRILDCHPANQIDALRAQLAASLAGIVSQQLLPRADGRGRVPAVEMLSVTPGVRNLIRRGKIEQLPSQMALEPSAGMIELDHSLASLLRRGLIEPSEARVRARAPDELDRRADNDRRGRAKR